VLSLVECPGRGGRMINRTVQKEKNQTEAKTKKRTLLENPSHPIFIFQTPKLRGDLSHISSSFIYGLFIHIHNIKEKKRCAKF
jgi:hypothetical protein